MVAAMEEDCKYAWFVTLCSYHYETKPNLVFDCHHLENSTLYEWPTLSC